MERISLSLSLSTLGLSLVVFFGKEEGGEERALLSGKEEERSRGIFKAWVCVGAEQKKKEKKESERGLSSRGGARAGKKKEKDTHTTYTHTKLLKLK